MAYNIYEGDDALLMAVVMIGICVAGILAFIGWLIFFV